VVVAACLVLLLLIAIVGALLRARGDDNAAAALQVAEAGALPAASAAPGDPTPTRSARPGPSVTPSTAAAAGKAGTTTGPRQPGADAGRRAAESSSKKGASLWKSDGMRAALADSGVSWFYTWSTEPAGVKAPSGVDFVPMIWGEKSVTTDGLNQAKRNGDVLLGFNEPDFASQSNLSVERALDLWPKLQATGMRLGSPAVAVGADQAGGWLDRFMSGAKDRGYRVDFITLHWYGGDFRTSAAVEQLRSYVEAAYRRYRKPIWLTEYALISFSGGTSYPSATQQAAFVTKSTAMLESLPYVERYAWFALPIADDGKDATGLYRPDGSRTAAGTAYRRAG
jgi:hypothetical protein